MIGVRSKELIRQNPAAQRPVKSPQSCQTFRHRPPMQEVCKKNIIQISKSAEMSELLEKANS
jgi:hypothetical protein